MKCDGPPTEIGLSDESWSRSRRVSAPTPDCPAPFAPAADTWARAGQNKTANTYSLKLQYKSGRLVGVFRASAAVPIKVPR
jgi:hypothetical protein